MNTSKKSKRRPRPPLQVELTVVVKTGERPQDTITILDEFQVPMVGSVFQYRDLIVHFFATSLVRVALASPAFYQELAPGLIAFLDGLRKRAR